MWPILPFYTPDLDPGSKAGTLRFAPALSDENI